MKIHSFEFNLFGVNTYLIWDELTLHTAVVDPGMSNSAECEVFARFVSDNSLDIVRLIDTHLHIDHTMGNEYVEATYHVGLTAHRADAPLGEMRRTGSCIPSAGSARHTGEDQYRSEHGRQNLSRQAMA